MDGETNCIKNNTSIIKTNINEYTYSTMKDKNIKPVDTVKYSHFKKCLTSLERDFEGRPEVLDNIDISFEYVIGSLFPNILSNIENTFTQNYIRGYNKGLSENFKSEKLEDISESKELIKETIKYIRAM